MDNKYEIRTGHPTRGSLWGWSHTFERAMQRAEKLAGCTRSDVCVKVVLRGEVLARSSTNGSMGGVPRSMIATTPTA